MLVRPPRICLPVLARCARFSTWKPTTSIKSQTQPEQQRSALTEPELAFDGNQRTALGIPASRPVHLPTQRSMWTVIRGPFVHKKSQENFERRVHKRAIKAWDADPEIVNMWVKYLRKHMMPGVGMRVTKWERAPVGIGQQVFQCGMEKLRLDTDAAKIVQQELMAN
ncbi:ribosomal protein S10 domain-containing protein, partial [Pisolithus sp. B1]